MPYPDKKVKLFFSKTLMLPEIVVGGDTNHGKKLFSVGY